jgi:carbon-monoxide dehydrogenase large subunit
LEVTKVYDPYFGTTTSATHIVALEIDPETYKVELNRYVVAEDCGHIINPMIVDGQVHGAVAQGIGAALYEEVIYDATGQLLTASLADYAIPTASVMPSIATVHLEAESPSTVNGFRGMGEGGTIGAPAAIANALADALAPLGAEIFELPMTPERLFRLIEKVKARAQGVGSLASGIESSNPLPSSGESVTKFGSEMFSFPAPAVMWRAPSGC